MTDAYKIGVSVALTNLVSAELGRIVTQLGLAHRNVEGLKLSFKGLAGLGVIGGLTVLTAALAAGVQEARKFQIEATKFSSLGFDDKVDDQAQIFARGMKTMGTSATENMSLVSDAMAVFKNLRHAEMAAPIMARMKFANEAVYGEEGGARTSKFMDMLKVIEFRGGLKSDAEFETQANYVQKVINGSRGRVDATQLLNALKTGGVSLATMSNDAFYLGSEPLIQEFGGMRYGTASMSIYQNLVQMRTTQRALTELMRLGLLDKSKVEMNQFSGKVKKAQPGAFIGADVLTNEGVLAFLEKVLLPAFRSHGITTDDQIIMELGSILTNRTGSSLLSRTYQQRTSLHNQSEANKSAMDISQLTNAADKTLDGKILELSAEWKKFELQLGILLPVVVKMTGWLVDIVKALQLDSSFSDKVGGFINNTVIGGTKDVWRNSTLASLFSSAPPRGQSGTPITVNMNVDGQRLAQKTVEVFLNGSRQAGTGNDVDFRSTFTSPGFASAAGH